MKFLFLSRENLTDSFFMKDLVYNMPRQEKVMIFHEDYSGSIYDTRFVTKRISALLSEAMIYNTAFSGDQRNLILSNEGKFEIGKDFILKQMEIAPVIVLNSLAASANGVLIENALELAKYLMKVFEITEATVFTKNVKSFLAAEKRKIADKSDFDELMNLFEEEKTALQNAFALSPAVVASPVNFAK